MQPDNEKNPQLRNVSSQLIKQHSLDSLPDIINQLRPKHIPLRMKKAISLQKIQYKQPISDRIQKQKSRYMKPLSYVQQIMKKFDEVANSKKSATQTPKQNSQLQQKFQTDLQKRMKQLLNLPTIKAIKQKMEKKREQKMVLDEPQTATLILMGEGMRLSILDKYDQYIKKAVKPTYRKLKTDYS